MEDIRVRPATEQDMTSVHALIVELAVYEKEPDAVTNTIDGLIEFGFGEKKVFDCIVAERNGTMLGFALFYTSYSTWTGPCLYLEDFLVTESERGKGIGKLLFEEVYAVAENRRVARFEWQVLDWNEPAINFYKKYQTQFETQWTNCKIVF